MEEGKERQPSSQESDVPPRDSRESRSRSPLSQRKLSRQSERGSFSSSRRRKEGKSEGEGNSEDGESHSPFDYSWESETQGSSGSGEESCAEGEISQLRFEFLKDFSQFCREQDFSNKSLSQLAVLWMLVIFRTPGGLGAFAEKTLKHAVSSQGMGEIWRDVLPLPVPSHVSQTVRQILNDEGFSFKKTGLTGNQVQAEYRRVGIDCLVFGLVTSLNYMWGGLREGSRVHPGPWRCLEAPHRKC